MNAGAASGWLQSWQLWAILSAVFAALTAIFAKVGVENVNFGDAAQVAPIDKLSVVLVAVFGVVFLGERLSVVSWAGIAMVAAGSDPGRDRLKAPNRPAPSSTLKNRATQSASATGCAAGTPDGTSPARGFRACRYRRETSARAFG